MSSISNILGQDPKLYRKIIGLNAGAKGYRISIIVKNHMAYIKKNDVQVLEYPLQVLYELEPVEILDKLEDL